MTESAPAAIALAMSPEYLIPPSAMTGSPSFRADFYRFEDGGDLRDSGAAHDAGGADASRAHADLDRVGAGVVQFLGGFAGRDIPGDQIRAS